LWYNGCCGIYEVLTVRKGKINRHERITQILINGKPVSPAEILECLKGTDQEKVGYRLSTNVYNIRKDGGIVKVIKSGRKVVGYQLVNFDQFDANGRFKSDTQLQTNATPVKSVVTKAVDQSQPAELSA
jgi:hypothetical protein